MKYAYTMDMSWQMGVDINLGLGTGLNTFTGLVAAPMGAGGVGGFNNGTASTYGTTIDLVWSGSGQRAFSYTMTFNEDVSTSSEKGMVGADADLYMGVVDNVVLKPATAIRAIPDSTFRQSAAILESGRMVEIAQGKDNNNKTLHLVRDEVVTYGMSFESNFIHSQKYIITELLPSLENVCRINREDGVKLYFEDGSWVICRFSGTEPLLRMAAEGESTEQADGYIAAWQNLLNL